MNTPDDPQVWLQRAQMLERAGRLAEAETAYAQLLQRWPQLTDTWYNLALLQRRMGRFAEALASYQQALDRGVSMPEEVHLNRGVIYSDCLRQDDAAERELDAALRINPLYVPALFNLANLREDFGRRADAIALYERILSLDPHHYEALSRYASLTLAKHRDDPIVNRLRLAIGDPATNVLDKASLGFALGKVLDACGSYDEAFDACSAANRDSRAAAPANAQRYDRAAHERLIDAIIAQFPAGPGATTTPLQPQPIFICGMFRSGSTLAEQVLAAHSQIRAGGELPFIPSVASQMLAPFPSRMSSVTEPQLRSLAQQYLDSLARLFPGASHVTDKRPDNFLYIGLIKRLFPNARIIHTQRQPLDNCLSIFFLHLDHRMSYALDLADIGHYYAQYRRLMAHWQSLYGADILNFDYDAFVADPEASTRELLAFCELPWEDAVLAFHQARTAVKTASVWQVRRPVYRESSGRWRRYERQLESLRRDLEQAGVETGD